MRASRAAPSSDDLQQPQQSRFSSVSPAPGRLTLPLPKRSSGVSSSATWTSTSGDIGRMSDADDIEDRNAFVDEYNRLAKKHGVRLLAPENPDNFALRGHERRNWFSRTFHRKSSANSARSENGVRHKRSVSDMARGVVHARLDTLKDQDLQGLVRLCGKSFFYLPSEYAPGSLTLPTCLRATAQYLVQHATETRGVFRIPGSLRIVNELYDFYCAAEARGDIANTVRSPNLPVHIKAGIHDVASTFKKFLAGLPGGILGSLSLFDALVAINSQLYGDPEFSRTKQSKLRARLIALAIGSLESQYRRELICAVFGLLCLLGRAAEVTPREDEFGNPIPTSDLMGYNALGIIFGPLLVGDLLDFHSLRLADPSAGLILLPTSPQPRSRKEKKKCGRTTTDEPIPTFLDVDKVHVANDITEMLITNWRDVVRQMKSLHILRSTSRGSSNRPRRASSLMRSTEAQPIGPFLARKPRSPDGSSEQRSNSISPGPRSKSESTASRRPSGVDDDCSSLSVKRLRPNTLRSAPSGQRRVSILSPPMEEAREELSGDGDELSSGRAGFKNACKLDSQAARDRAESADQELLSPSRIPLDASTNLLMTPASTNLKPGPKNLEQLTDTSLSPQKSPTIQTPKADSVVPERKSSLTPSLNKKDSRSTILKHSADRSSRLSDLDLLAHYPNAGTKVLSAKSTMRFQPKGPSLESSEIERVKLRTTFHRSRSRSSMRSDGSDGASIRNDHATQTSPNCRDRDAIGHDQVNGAASCVTNVSHRDSFRQLKNDLKRETDGHLSPIDVSFHDWADQTTQLLGRTPQIKAFSMPTPSTTKLLGTPIDARRPSTGAGSVRAMAAMFDNAAKASSSIPTPCGGTHSKRLETSRMMSPYTSNPSPQASLRSVVSNCVSTPIETLMTPKKTSINAQGSEMSPRKSMIPRRQEQRNTDSGRTDRHGTPSMIMGSRISASKPSNSAPSPTSRLPTPSKLPVRKKVSANESSNIPQFDGSKLIKSPLKLTPIRYEFRPVEPHSSPLSMRTKARKDRRSQDSTTTSSETLGQDTTSTSLAYSGSTSPTTMTSGISRERGLSLRDQIRSLKDELNAKVEDCAQLRRELEFRSRDLEVTNSLNKDLERAREDSAVWKRRAEAAERRVTNFKKLAMNIQNLRESGGRQSTEEEGSLYSFASGSDHIDIGRESLEALAERWRISSVRDVNGNVSMLVGGDALSDTGTTVVRNISNNGDEDGDEDDDEDGDEDGAAATLWSAVDELVDFATSSTM